jgi:hypothetical protein
MREKVEVKLEPHFMWGAKSGDVCLGNPDKFSVRGDLVGADGRTEASYSCGCGAFNLAAVVVQRRSWRDRIGDFARVLRI